jgi:cytochrome P450
MAVDRRHSSFDDSEGRSIQVNVQMPPGPREWPFVGSLLAFNRDPLRFIDSLYREYGEVATITMMGLRFVVFAHPRAIKHILVDNARSFTNREAYPELRMLIGDGLLTIDGAEHRQQRRIVQPAFHRTRIERYAETMLAYTRRLLDSWEPGAEVDVADAMSRLTMAIAGATLFGVDLIEETAAIGRAFLQAAEYTDLPAIALGHLPINLPFTPYGKFIRAKQQLDEVVTRIIAGRRQGNQEGDDVLSMLLAARDENGAPLTDRQVRDHVLTFLAAGHATTANALTWTFYLLAQHPRVMAKLTDELSTVLAGRDPSVEDLARLPYLEAVVKESMRLYPPAWAQARRAVADFDLEGYHFPGGSYVIVSQWVTHRRPDLWQNPEQFLPERFGPAAEVAIPPLAYFPFGAGPRTCIGMPFAMLEARLVLATILQRFRPMLAPGFRVVPRALIILQPANGLRVRLEQAERPVQVGSSVG